MHGWDRVRGEESRKSTEGGSLGDDIHEVRGERGEEGLLGWGNTNSVLTACRTVTRYL